MYPGLHVKRPIFLPYFCETLNFVKIFSRNSPIPNFMKILPMGAEFSVRKDGETEEQER
jgi:hypothetical protein